MLMLKLYLTITTPLNKLFLMYALFFKKLKMLKQELLYLEEEDSEEN